MEPLSSHIHDSMIRLTDAELDMVTKDVSLVIEDAVKAKDSEGAFRYAEALIRMQQASWAAMSHWMYIMSEKWGDEFPSDDDFITVASSRLNKSRTTLRRYLEVWKHVIEGPGHTKERLEALIQKPLYGLWYIKAAAEQDQLTAEDWDAIEKAPDIATLRDIGRGARGEVGRAISGLKIMIEDDGTLKARRKGHYKIVGHLNTNEEDDVVTAACSRIINESGIFSR